MTKADWTVFLN